ncbi:hypothetical protein HZB97_03145 [Candidatus Gottesmanbacteria bacterium]|nr:hypothetical protein [Candidatus Gottesmanbacteria bacterium]
MQVIFYIFVLGILLLFLYFFHRLIIKYFSLVSFLAFGTSKIGVYLYFLFFLPGVILHELSHLFTASILGVPSGKLKVFPTKTEQGWSLGQVSSAETDILRSSLIGLAPIVVGTASLLVIVNLGLGIKDLAKNILLLYLLLAFTNTMFLSEEDRTSIWAFPSLLVILFLFGRAMGWVGVLTTVENLFYQIVSPLILSFSLTVLVDFLFFLPLVLLVEILLRIRA